MRYMGAKYTDKGKQGEHPLQGCYLNSQSLSIMVVGTRAE